MSNSQKSLNKLIDSLDERVKELNCLYEVEELLRESDLDIKEILQKTVNLISPAFQYPEITHTRINYYEHEFTSDAFNESPWVLNSDINVQDTIIGSISVYYAEERPDLDVGPFLVDEKRLIDSIAIRISHQLMYQKLKIVFNRWEDTKENIGGKKSGEWQVILELLRRTDSELFVRVSRKMLNYLIWQGVEEAEQMLQDFNPYATEYHLEDVQGEKNTPLDQRASADMAKLSKNIFKVASHHLANTEILSRIQLWVQEDKTSFLVRTTSDNNSSLTEISDSIRRYYQLNPVGMDLTPSTRIGVRAALIRRFFSDQLEFINIAKNYCRVVDFNNLLKRTIFPIGSHGKLGGKSAGMFLAYRILKQSEYINGILKNVKVPKTWYITSDTMIQFMHHNNLDEMLEQKYKPIEEVRKEYPHVVQLFKRSHFPVEIIQGLSMALDDFGDHPLVVRSSSLLEDRLGSVFSGKYKSLFLSNRGTKSQRLADVSDAIAEVYASTIGPDPIEYRSERGLLDFHEEMGIMIQEVVGTEVGDYFFPSFAGVAFSNNEFRWSPRIHREDGLVRMVPGLGTRAVDRLSDDYPILVAPGQPGLRSNVGTEEIVRYSPQKMDVINLKTGSFESVDVQIILKECGNDFPLIEKLISLYDEGQLTKPGFFTDYNDADPVFTFNGLLADTNFLEQADTILKELQNKLATPVDIEFAHDGSNFYLVQCRPQSYSKYTAPAPLPKNIAADKYIFTANRFISNGTVSDIRYIVYVDPEQYGNLTNLDELNSVGRAVGQLNKILPKHGFVLMGPGRWGSRGDIKLGVSVTYSDINNTAMLIEIARKKGNYVPDLSFGTHFFQDLVEAGIRYLPLYPDEEGSLFNEDFLINSPNALSELLPAYSYLSNVIHIVEVHQASNGLLMHVFMNADKEKAVAILGATGFSKKNQPSSMHEYDIRDEDHWQWRLQMAEHIATIIDVNRFGVKGLYVIGSTKNSTAQAGSDIDLLVHFYGSKKQKEELNLWFEGWSLCLDEMNYQRTGFKAGGLLDIHYLSTDKQIDEDQIAKKFGIISRDGIKKLDLPNREK